MGPWEHWVETHRESGNLWQGPVRTEIKLSAASQRHICCTHTAYISVFALSLEDHSQRDAEIELQNQKRQTVGFLLAQRESAQCDVSYPWKSGRSRCLSTNPWTTGHSSTYSPISYFHLCMEEAMKKFIHNLLAPDFIVSFSKTENKHVNHF